MMMMMMMMKVTMKMIPWLSYNLCSTLFCPHHFDFDQLSSSLRPAIFLNWLNIPSITSASSSEEELNSIAARIAIRMAPWTVIEHLKWDEVVGKVFQTKSCSCTLGFCNVKTYDFKATCQFVWQQMPSWHALPARSPSWASENESKMARSNSNPWKRRSSRPKSMQHQCHQKKSSIMGHLSWTKLQNTVSNPIFYSDLFGHMLLTIGKPPAPPGKKDWNCIRFIDSYHIISNNIISSYNIILSYNIISPYQIESYHITSKTHDTNNLYHI